MLTLDSLQHALRRARVLDGGLATELEQRGVSIDGPLWSARALREAPEAVRAVHRDYLEAGADILLTAGYQVSTLGFLGAGLAPDEAASAAAHALRRSVELAAQVRSEFELTRTPEPAGSAASIETKLPQPLLAASLGPYGAALANGAEFHGNYGFSTRREQHAALVRFHAQRIAVLVDVPGDSGKTSRPTADLLAFETVPSLAEARAILEALTSFPQVGAWLSFTCRDQAHTAHGELLRDCAALLNPYPQVVALGVNCTAPALIPPLLHQFRAATAKPLLAYPNSGEQWDAANRRWTGSSDIAAYAAQARQWFQAGAQIVGGCCRTTPAHIRAVKECR